MTIEEANRLIVVSLLRDYDEREAATIGSMVMERLTGISKSQRFIQRTMLFTKAQEEKFQIYLAELMKHRPVQYVLGEAWFGPYKFFVDENVLIPRPETEELADWLLRDSSMKGKGLSVLDIGTGSGCIPVYLVKKRNDLKVSAIDISEDALEIARKNSRDHNAEITFFRSNILDPLEQEKINPVDIIISNPPYVPEKQKTFLDRHVRDFEPPIALFVPDDDPILFYKVIGKLAEQKLNAGGLLFLEIHHDHASQIISWYEQHGFSLEMKKDMSGNDRMIKAWRN